MALGVLFSGYILKVLKDSTHPLTRNAIRKKLEKAYKTTFAWETVDAHLQRLRKEGRVVEELSGKIRLYSFKRSR